MNKKSRTIDIILNSVISLLVISMLLLTVLFAFNNTMKSSGKAETFDKLWIVEDTEEIAFSQFDISYIVPELIAYKLYPDDAVATTGDQTLTSTLYSVLSDAVSLVLGSDSVCITENISYIDSIDKLKNADSFILFNYAAALPYQSIYAFTSAQSTVDSSMCAKGDSASIKTLALILEKDADGGLYYSCYGFTDDSACKFEHSNGTLYKLQTADRIYLEAYTDNLNKVDFAQYDSLELLHGSFGYYPIYESSDIAMLSFENEEARNDLLRLFQINPEKTNNYIDRDGSVIFIGTGERLSVNADNSLEYSGENGVISLKELLGYTPGQKGAFSVFDMLKATNIFINNIKSKYPEFFGNNATTLLTGFYKDEYERPVIEYSYYFNGIKIDTKPAFRFVFNSDGICVLESNIAGYTSDTQKSAMAAKSDVYNVLLQKHGNINRLMPVYSQGDDGIYRIKWALWQ